MARSVAFYLTRFDEPSESVLSESAEPIILGATLFEPTPAKEEEPEPVEALTDVLRAQLVEEGRDSAKAEYDELIERERGEFDQRLEEERRRWAREEGARLGDRFRSALDELSTRLGDEVGRVLEPFVSREIRERMLVDLVERLRVALADRDDVVVRLSGPADLLDAVCEKLDREGIATRIEDVGGVELRARLDSTTIETRLGEWAEQLRARSDDT
jgi:hypothetical protein